MANPAANPALILASGSRYRAELLGRLQLPFRPLPSQVDETPQPGENPRELTQRLAIAKARALAQEHPQAWILGSDQSAAAQGRLLGKPGTLDRAREQLQLLSGQTVEFLTAVALVQGTRLLQGLDVTTVRFRRLDAATIDRYLAAEPALDCAGSFKCEGLGISLFEEMRSTDPTGLVGLPLIRTAALLREAGFRIP
ncbi:septum formation protein Maf [Solimonas fluminis]|uniref:7-methyl-GTP pyrophosphatase n=1 Tax=Solimonas fluminis TaxID=2086571 RepID=A0A2S5TD30_9GAMM|nr:nucleoside triphosphate pyrophosphatase [Solimonas fluminis]PPE72910.1 septum formation protein Maf [Solimonas fluminis]